MAEPPIDTIAGVVADAVRRSLGDMRARPQVETPSVGAQGNVDTSHQEY